MCSNCWIFHDSVHLVELVGTGEYFAMKSMDKNIVFNRNKVDAQVISFFLLHSIHETEVFRDSI